VRFNILSALALVIFTPALGLAQEAGSLDGAAALIDPAGARKHVAYLADDARAGRAVGTAGNLDAGDYIAGRLAHLGLQPGAPGTGKAAYFQPFTREGVSARNIVALREGREPDLGHIVIGAHYDHVGMGEEGGIPSVSGMVKRFFGAKETPEIHNGADDNASGTAAILEIAEALAALKTPPRRTIVLILFDGEERGLWGSEHYADHPLLPIEKCAAMINLDMVGRAEEGRCDVLAANSGSGIPEIIAAENAGIGLALDMQPYNVPNSDHYSFSGKKVPVAFFTTGLHPDYHRPSDDTEKINEKDLARVARLAFRTAVRLAEAEQAPVFAEVGFPPPGALALEMLNAMTGSDFFKGLEKRAYGSVEGAFVRAAPEGGLAVDYVAPGSRFAKAGLQAGDRIVGAGGDRISGTLGRRRLSELVKDGGSPEVEVMRGKKRLSLSLSGKSEAVLF
jgi:hypothetical protein